MLTSVLLDVVKPARPIYASFNKRSDLRCASLDYVPDAVGIVYALNYADSI
jgi:hypothetical protein